MLVYVNYYLYIHCYFYKNYEKKTMKIDKKIRMKIDKKIRTIKNKHSAKYLYKKRHKKKKK